MKKSHAVVLTAVMAAAISSCMEQRNWIYGYAEEDCPHDTMIDGMQLRLYEGAWYPVRNDLINPYQYWGAGRVHYSTSHIAYRHTRSHGFGGSARHTVGS